LAKRHDTGTSAQALTIDMAALGHALHGAIRPAALLPDAAPLPDPFAQALRKIEFESNRLIQAQILFLKSADLLPFHSAVNTAVESRHAQVRKLLDDMLSGISVERGSTDRQRSRQWLRIPRRKP
jgi:hypothetical protein